MIIKFWKYDLTDSKKVQLYFEALGYPCAIIGSLKKNGHSNNDIDIWLPRTEYSTQIRSDILIKLEQPNYEMTDWGSVFAYNTAFGNLDIFFRGQTDKFDY